MARVAFSPPGLYRARELLEQSRLCSDVLAGLHLLARALDQPGLTADVRAEIHLQRAVIESAALLRTEDAIASFEAAADAGASAGLRAVAIAGATTASAPAIRSTKTCSTGRSGLPTRRAAAVSTPCRA